jgi:GTPase SAR1 family protein
MSISIIKNKEIKLDIPQFNCDDNVVGDHLNSHSLLKLLNSYSFLCIIGRPGQGKTSLAISFITQKNPKIYRKTHHHILICMPQNSINSLKKNPFKQLPEENFYHELTDESISDMYNRIDKYSNEDEKTILFIDDMTASLKSSSFIQQTLKTMVYNRRHLKLNVIITAQSYVNIPLDVRKSILNLIMFKPSKKEFEKVFEELLEAKKDICLKVLKNVFNKGGHNFFFLNVTTQRMFKNWDEIILNDDSDSEVEK